MKIIKNMFWGSIDDKSVLIVGSDYNGSPVIKFEYDILIIDEKKFNQYKTNLIFEHEHLKIKKPKIFFI